MIIQLAKIDFNHEHSPSLKNNSPLLKNVHGCTSYCSDRVKSYIESTKLDFSMRRRPRLK